MQYVMDGFTHKSQNWCNAAPSGDVTGFNITARPGFTAVGMSAIVDRFHTILAPLADSVKCAPALAILYDFSAPSFPFPIATYAPTVSYSGSGSVNFAYGWTIFVRDTSFEKAPFPLFELLFGLQSFKNNVYSSLATAIKPVVNYLTNAGGTAAAADAYAWRQSRSARYMTNYVSGTWDTNEKLRRKRGIK
jgi:hypothetical protein